MTVQLIKRQKLPTTVSDELLALIVRGKYLPGSRLPPERVLAEQMGISRTSLRNAIGRLEVLGHLEVQQGNGIYVCEPTATKLTQPFQGILTRSLGTVEDLHEFRRMIEPEVAALAAQHATETQIIALQINIAQQHEFINEKIKLSELDMLFHQLIAEIAGNAVVMLVLDTLQSMLMDLRQQSPGNLPLVTLSDHQALVDAIAQHNPDTARQAMLCHLTNIYISKENIPCHSTLLEESL